MDVRELRVGNWVKMISKNKYYFIDRGQDLDNSEDFEPIEINEEILLKCGFDLNSIPYHAIKGQVVLSLFRGVWAFKHVHIEVKYLHQLQNLYFALTGEELNVQL